MTTRADRNSPWIERPLFWTIILSILFFLLGVGLGARLAMLGVRQQLDQLALSNTNQSTPLPEVSGEIVGTISSVSTDQLTITAQGSTYTFTLSPNTELFSYSGESTPLLPGEVRPKITLGLADLQPNDMVVVQYGEGQQAVSIQKIR